MTRLVFGHVYVGWNMNHMHQLKHLSTSSVSEHVRCMTVNIEVLPPLGKRRYMECLYQTEVNERNPNAWAENPHPAHIYDCMLSVFSNNVLETDWKEFQNIVVNQQLWGHHIGELLAKVLQSLSKLEHLQFIDTRGIHVDELGYVIGSRHSDDPVSDPLTLYSPWKTCYLLPTSITSF